MAKYQTTTACLLFSIQIEKKNNYRRRCACEQHSYTECKRPTHANYQNTYKKEVNESLWRDLKKKTTILLFTLATSVV